VVTRDALAREVRRAVRIAGFGALTTSMLPGLVAHELLTPEARRDDVRRRWVGTWADALLRIFGVSAIVRHDTEHPARAGRGRLVVANHRSTADVLLLLRTFGGRMVSRADLAGWSLVGSAARAAGTLFVNRADAASGATAVRLIRSRLVAGDTVIVFPEGTTFPDGEVRPFHAGAFVAAARSDADIVPVGLAYQTGSGAAFVGETFPAHLSRMAAASPSRVALWVGRPIPTGERAAALRDAAHVEVQRLVRQARALVDPPR
jgi:lyso-ornithine lipid O-acyltransferase